MEAPHVGCYHAASSSPCFRTAFHKVHDEQTNICQSVSHEPTRSSRRSNESKRRLAGSQAEGTGREGLQIGRWFRVGCCCLTIGRCPFTLEPLNPPFCH